MRNLVQAATIAMVILSAFLLAIMVGAPIALGWW